MTTENAGRAPAAGGDLSDRVVAGVFGVFATLTFLGVFVCSGQAWAADGSTAEVSWTPLWIGAGFQVVISLVAAALNRQASAVSAATDRRLDQLENNFVEISGRLSTTREQMALREDLARLDQKLSDRLDEVLKQNHQVLALLNAPGSHR